MARIDVYLDAEELEWVKAKPKGFVRGLVRGEMSGTIEQRAAVAENRIHKDNPQPLAPDATHLPGHCAVCGEKLNYFGQPHGCRGKR